MKKLLIVICVLFGLGVANVYADGTGGGQGGTGKTVPSLENGGDGTGPKGADGN